MPDKVMNTDICNMIQSIENLFDLLGLQLNRLVIDKDTLALVGFRSPPCSDLGSKLHHNFLLTSLQ